MSQPCPAFMIEAERGDSTLSKGSAGACFSNLIVPSLTFETFDVGNDCWFALMIDMMFPGSPSQMRDENRKQKKNERIKFCDETT